MRRDILICLLLLAVTVGVYWPVGTHEFINYDDPLYVTENPRVRAGLTGAGVVWAFGKITSEERNYYHPITWLSHMLDSQLFGMNASAHHLMNLAFHAANVLLLFLLLKQMTGCAARSAAVAGLFALHPLQVDTVAWIAERKNVLSTLFWLLTLLAYLRYAKKPGLARYLPVFCLFALGLMCKPMLVTVPCVLLLLDFWPLNRFAFNRKAAFAGQGCEQRPLVEKAEPPRIEETQAKFPPLPKGEGRGEGKGTVPTPAINLPRTTLPKLLLEKLPLFGLAAISGFITILGHQRLGLITTTEQLPWTDRLIFTLVSYLNYLDKAIWPAKLSVFYPMPQVIPPGEILWAGLVLGGITLLALKTARQKPYLLVGWLWFLGTLVPVIGILQVSQQAMADRWAYVPLIGLCIMAVWGAADLVANWRPGRVALALMIVALLSVFAVRTRAQLAFWQNSETLFRHALAVTTNNPVAHLNLGSALATHGKLDEALKEYDEVLKIQPNSPLGHFDRGSLFALRQNFDEAIAEYRLAIHYLPDYPRAQCNWGNVLALEKKYDEAKPHFLEAIRLDPLMGEPHGELANIYFLTGEPAKAEAEFQTAVKLDPALFEAQYVLAGILARQKKFDEAVRHYRASLKYKADNASALNDLAWILATDDDSKVYNPADAVKLAARACELTHNEDANYLDTLGVAYSEVGRFADAIKTTLKAVDVAHSAGNEIIATKIGEHLAYYRQNHSYRTMTRLGL